MFDASCLWLVPGRDHPAFSRYVDLFSQLFRSFDVLDYRAEYLEFGRVELERRVVNALKASTPQLLLYSQFPSSYSYLAPEFIANLRASVPVVGLGFDDEIYFDQAKYFYQACSFVITTDFASAAWLNEAGITTHVVVTSWLKHRQLPEVEEDIAVSFVGDLTKPGRREYIRHLEAHSIPVADFGDGSRHGKVPDAKVPEIFCRSKINLNFTATNPPRWVLRHDPMRARVRQIKGRPFDLAALGRFCLCEWAPCVERWFRPGIDIGVFRDPDDLVAQVRRYLHADQLRHEISASARERYRTELAPEVQFARVFSRILADARDPIRPRPMPALGGSLFYESMGRSRGVAFLHALRRGSPLRAVREIWTKWSRHPGYWRGFAQAVIDTIASRMRA